MRHGGHFFRILLTAVLLLGLLPLNIWAAEGQSAGEATVLFTHDLHSCFFPRVQEGGEERGGFARLAAALAEERTGHPDALTVDAGDFSSGSLVQTLSTTRAPELVTLGAMGYDAVTAGNHEFDNGSLGFGEMLTAAGRGGGALPALVMANYRPGEDDPNRLDLQRAMAAYGVQEYLLLERGGVTYGIFGLMGQDAHASAPTSSFVLEDPAQAAQRCVSRLEEQGAEFIICLSHSGTSQTSASEDEELARAVPEIDLIVSGHTHTTLPEPIVVGDTYIVSAGSNCENLGSITLSWNGAGEKTLEGYRLIPIDGTAGEDPEISALTQDWKEQVDIGYLGSYGLTYDQVLTRSDFFLPLPQAGVQDGNALGELTADSFAWAARTIAGLPEGEPLIALTADGVLRAPLPRGNVTTAQVFDVLKRAEFTVSADGTVEFRRGDTLYGPYTAREDPSAVPEEHWLKEDMRGVELRCGDEVIFRGGVLDRRDSLLLYNEDGTASSAGFVVTTNGGMAIDGSGNVIDPLEPGANNVLELLSGPRLTHKGSWWGYFAGVFICLITAASILYADELFRWGLSFSIRHPERAEPSDWEIAGRYISWTALAVMALAVFIIGLRA